MDTEIILLLIIASIICYFYNLNEHFDNTKECSDKEINNAVYNYNFNGKYVR